ncbi:hypothetical protein BGZ74_011895 [Mortierella antarctica]|nr:hypothetical protein BGZ74_011895 [Mortierella antarctica]
MHKKFAEIPELLSHLSRFLSTQDLLSCVQVSSQWNHAFIPFLWRTIDDTSGSWSNILWHCEDPAARSKPWLSILGEKAKESDKNKDREWILHVFRKSLTLALRKESLPQRRRAGGGWGGAGAGGSEAATPNFVMPAPLFPGIVEEDDFIPPVLNNLDPEVYQEYLERGWVMTQHFWCLIQSNRDLVRLNLVSSGACQWSPRSDLVRLKAVAKLTRLKELIGWWLKDMTAMWRLLDAVPTLEALTTDCYQGQIPDPLPKVNTTLRALSVIGSALTPHYMGFGITINSLLDILGLFPNLSSLTVPTIGSQVRPQAFGFGSGSAETIPRGPEKVTPRGANIGANLRELVVANVHDYATLMKHLPDRVELTWNEEPVGDNRIPLQLPEHSTRFGVFKATHRPWYIDEGARLDHDVANDLLVTSSRLRVFDSIRHYIRVDEMLRQPWACMGLEWLSCRIVGMDRLDDEEQPQVDRVMAPGYTADLSAEEGAAVEKFQRCQAQHHGVYDRLACLTKLKHLDLGYENRYPWQYKGGNTYEVDGKEYVLYDTEPTFDTLELSLASGLDRLDALKSLEMIGFERINHRIGRAELEWMAKNWPRLKLMYGLDKERLYYIEPSQERGALREYFQQLRPDVIHDSLFENTC